MNRHIAGMKEKLDELKQRVQRLEEKMGINGNGGGVLQEIEGDARTACLYAYRYLLNREPENIQVVEGNKSTWQDLRDQFIKSTEYRLHFQPWGDEPIELLPPERVFLHGIFLHKAPTTFEKVLEIGCGEGRMTRAMSYYAPQAEVIGIDPFLDSWWHMGELSGKNWRVENGDGQAIQYPDNAFDLVFAVNVFEHVPSPEKCLAEIKRVLKPGGLFVSSFEPIWTGIVGHHCEHWIEDTVKIIPPWGHLYMSYGDMLQHLQKQVDPDRAKSLCDMIYKDQVINRVDIRRFEQAFFSCGLRMLEKKYIFQENRLAGFGKVAGNELTADMLRKLDGRYNAEELLTTGYYLVMQKDRS